MFDQYLRAWNLIPDGAPLITRASCLLPVRQNGAAAMLKIADHDDERIGGSVMQWWNGEGAARVLARDGVAVLLERAEGPASLAEMSRTGRDDEACAILCTVAARLQHTAGHALGHLGRGIADIDLTAGDVIGAAVKRGGAGEA